MVEENSSSSNYMRSLLDSRASAPLPLSAASSFAFGSCKEGWYYRCLGVDPWDRDLVSRSLFIDTPFEGFFIFLIVRFFFVRFFGRRASFGKFLGAIVGSRFSVSNIIWGKKKGLEYLGFWFSFFTTQRCCCTSIRRTRMLRATGSWSASMCWEALVRFDLLWARSNLLLLLLIPRWNPTRERAGCRFLAPILTISSYTAQMLDQMVIRAYLFPQFDRIAIFTTLI